MTPSPEFFTSPISRAIWEDRYGLKDETGKLIESSILASFRRVAKAIASNEVDKEAWGKAFYNIMAERYFCPAGRILAHAGTHYQQLLNCFVLPFRSDSLEEIMHTAADMAIIQKFAGGTGFNYSTLRPEGSYIKGVNGRSCGVLGFLSMMSVTSEVIEQGGSRRGANLGLLEAWHPDLWEFISYKTDHNWDRLTEFMDVKDQEKWSRFKFENMYKWQMYNVSVGVTDEFLHAVKNDEEWVFKWKNTEWQLYTVEFVKALSGGGTRVEQFKTMADSDATALWKVRKKVPYPTANDKFHVVSKSRILAKDLWDRICQNAWADGCPGIINLSTARKFHNLEYIHPLLTTNPCGEQPLPAHGSCNLGSLILSSFVVDNNGKKEFDFEKFAEVIHVAVRFMDNVIDICEFPLDDIKKVAHEERRVGLGTMGVHDLLIELGLGYDTQEGRDLVEKVLKYLRDESYLASIELAKTKGAFPIFDSSLYMQSEFIKTLPLWIRDDIAKHGIRNSHLTSQAPTGTIGTMYGVSTGCEPWFALSFQRNSRLGSYEDGCQAYIRWKAKNPEAGVKPSYFKTAQEISPEDHIKMMILFSRYIDSATSKTVNLSNHATVEDVKKAFMFAMENGVKGITVFRDGSKEAVLVSKDTKPEVTKEKACELDEVTSANVQSHFKKRGGRTVGATSRVHLEGHNMYVTVNKNWGGEMVEVFATVGESKTLNTRHTSGIEDSWAEGLGKVISLALRAGVNPESIIRNLKNIPSDKPVFTVVGDCENSELIPSPPHAIGRVMEEEMRYQGNIQIKSEIQIKGSCENCGSTNVKFKSPTCYECADCGHSKCG